MKKKITLLLIFILFFTFGCGSNEEKKETKKDNNKEVSYNGVYQKDNDYIKLFQISKKLVHMETDSSSMDLEIIDNQLKGDIWDDEITIKIVDKGIEVETTVGNIKSGTYPKKGDYTKEEYYKDNIGELEYLNSKYNGIYKLDDKILETFQVNEEEVRVNVNGEYNEISYSFEHDLTIEQDESLKDNEASIIFNDNKLSITFNDSEYQEALGGTYEKADSMTIDKIIEKY